MLFRVITLLSILFITVTAHAELQDFGSDLNYEEKIKSISQDESIHELSREINKTPEQAADGLVRIGQAADTMLISLNDALYQQDEDHVQSALFLARQEVTDINTDFPESTTREIFNLIVSARLGECIDMYQVLFPEQTTHTPFCKN